MTPRPIAVAVLTYRRFDDLDDLLTQLVTHVATSSSSDASIVVIDNDEDPTAEVIARRHPGVRYVHEPRPGIAAARTRALSEAGDELLLVFIDDDERPRDGWLDSLVATWEQCRPAAVVGPVVSTFAAPPDPWIEAGGFFVRLRHRTGTEVKVAATNNLLLDLSIVRELDLRFDDRFGTTGGSDTLFTRRLVHAGERIVWCDEAVVTDVVPSDRSTREWVLRRAERMGNSSSRVAVVLAPSGWRRWLVRLGLVTQGLGRIAVGGGRSVYGRIVRSPRHHARGARLFARGRGILSGALGGVVAEYGRETRAADPPAQP